MAAAGMILGVAAPANAQEAGRTAAGWNDPATTALVVRAVERRAQQLADTGLRDYTARATGYLTFLGQLGEGLREPPRILKADQLALEIFWRAPDLSKQRIIGRRDTLLLPTDINYHRDHLGIIQNNFPEIIRLGDGDEVRDVPHPLSPAGLGTYDFRIRDSLRIALPGQAIEVYEVMVRPRNDREARVIGSVFIERSDAQVVRMAFSFTRAAFLDRQLEDLSIVLENGLIGSRFWLPRRQEIEIRRAATWLDYPARGIIRGRWEIGDYELNPGLPESRFTGPEIVPAPRAEVARYPWAGGILDSLPADIRATVDPDVARVQEEARALVREQALQRVRGSVLSARAVSDLVRSNRVEGLALGAGISRRLGHGVTASARMRYGTDDEAVKGAVAVGWQRASGVGVGVRAYRDLSEAGDVAERSGIANSIAAQEAGSDYTDPYAVQGAALELGLGRRVGADWWLAAASERHHDLRIESAPAFGRFEGLLAFPTMDVRRLNLRVERPTALAPFGTEVRVSAEMRVSRFVTRHSASVTIPDDQAPAPGTAASNVTRASMLLHAERPFGAQRLVSRTVAAAARGTDGVPPQELVLFGGPVSAPGYDYHALVATRGLAQRLEVQRRIPFVPFSLGRFGRAPAEATVAPYVSAVLLGGQTIGPARRGADGTIPLTAPGTTGQRVHPSVGVGFLTFFDLIRFDVARGLRGGRWTFSVDVNADFWRIL